MPNVTDSSAPSRSPQSPLLDGPGDAAGLEVVFVHGAFTDASSWCKVLRLLGTQGVKVSAVQLPLTGFASDVLAVRQHLDARSGEPVLLVGHSYGGCVVTEVAAGNDQVVGLVYIAAAAPLAKVPFGAYLGANPGAYVAQPQVDSHGLLRLSPEDFIRGLAHDLPEAEARLLWAIQRPVPAAAFGDHATAEGWREKPCWYLVADDDQLMPAQAQRYLAEQMGADTRTTKGGHMLALSQPEAVSALVREVVLACATV